MIFGCFRIFSGVAMGFAAGPFSMERHDFSPAPQQLPCEVPGFVL